MIKLLIFDFDGIIAKSKSLYREAIIKILNKHGYSIAKRDIEGMLGQRLETIIPSLGIKRDFKVMKREINDSVTAVAKSNKLKPCPYIKSINSLKGCNKVIVSNSLVGYMKPLIKKNKLKFDEVIGPEMSSKQRIFRYLFKKYRVKPSEAVYIGDRAQDVQIAKQAGCKSIAVSNKCSWNSKKEIEKEKPDALIKSLLSLNQAIKRL